MCHCDWDCLAVRSRDYRSIHWAITCHKSAPPSPFAQPLRMALTNAITTTYLLSPTTPQIQIACHKLRGLPISRSAVHEMPDSLWTAQNLSPPVRMCDIPSPMSMPMATFPLTHHPAPLRTSSRVTRVGIRPKITTHKGEPSCPRMTESFVCHWQMINAVLSGRREWILALSSSWMQFRVSIILSNSCWAALLICCQPDDNCQCIMSPDMAARAYDTYT